MSRSRAEKDREKVTESLRRHGFGEAGIEAVFEAERVFAEAEKADRLRKPEEPATLDFGDWDS